MTILVDIQYFPPVIFFTHLNGFTHCIFDQYEHFQKMSFRNRCTLPAGNGPVVLSVPLEGGRNQKTVMKDVRILNSERWQDRHWKTITSCYNKSPWFEHFRDELERIYLVKVDFLVDWNFICFQWVADKLSIQTTVSLSDHYYEKDDLAGVEDWRGKLMPSTINKHFADVERYPQVFEERFGFIPNMSVLDYLFCTGPL